MAEQVDKRLIEDYLPIQAISKEALGEKSVCQRHIPMLHLWWAAQKECRS